MFQKFENFANGTFLNNKDKTSVNLSHTIRYKNSHWSIQEAIKMK